MVTGVIDVAVNVALPAGVRPAGGCPVALLAHAGRVNKNFIFPNGAVLNAHGLAGAASTWAAAEVR